jgi:hypothetical protein
MNRYIATSPLGRAVILFGAVLAGVAGTGCKSVLAVRPHYAFKIRGSTNDIPAGRIAGTNGWRFVHVAESLYETRRGKDRIVQDFPSQWYLAYPEADPHKRMGLFSYWSNTIQYHWMRKYLPEIADAAKAQFGVYPSAFETQNVFDASSVAAPKEQMPTDAETPPKQDVELKVRKVGVHGWPAPHDAGGHVEPVWHLGEKYSQLSKALDRVETEKHGAPWTVTVGIIDTGYSRGNGATPWKVRSTEAGDAWNQLSCRMVENLAEVGPDCTNKYPVINPSRVEVGHGTGTVGILAGGKVHIPPTNNVAEYRGYLGGVPNATIVPVRVAPWVVSLQTANFAYGLDYASRIKHCDVISISHGGSPSMLWYDTINSAYWRGTAMVAACGDFFSFGPAKRALFPIPPSNTLYPAAARRVLAVTGATSENRTYAGPTMRGWLDCVTHLNPFGPFERGSYGADGSWRNALGRDDVGDRIAAARQGRNRIQPIAAWSPNIPWLVPPSEVKGETNVVDLDGGGTSAATPQVAAAAALWLEKNQQYWTGLPSDQRWRKPEAVYQALLRTADRPWGRSPDRYLGAGLLKADKALDLSFPEVTLAPAQDRFEAFDRSPRDFFDGDKSFDKIIARIEGDASADGSVTEKLKNQLQEAPDAQTTRNEALFRCFYNTRIIEAWHKGRNPEKRERDRFKAKSQRDADEAP